MNCFQIQISTHPPPIVSAWQLYGNAFYVISNTSASWVNAELSCESLASGSKLASIHSIAENSFISSMVNPSGANQRWIGGKLNRTSTPQTGTFRYLWTDGTPYNFTNYAPGQPADDGFSDCLLIDKSSPALWTNANCSLMLRFVCKRPGLPWASCFSVADVIINFVHFSCPMRPSDDRSHAKPNSFLFFRNNRNIYRSNQLRIWIHTIRTSIVSVLVVWILVLGFGHVGVLLSGQLRPANVTAQFHQDTYMQFHHVCEHMHFVVSKRVFRIWKWGYFLLGQWKLEQLNPYL